MAHGTHHEPPVLRLHPIPSGMRVGAAALVVLGVIGLVAALLVDPTRAWRAYLINWLFFMGIAQGAVLLAAVVSITKGIWSRPIRRFALSFAAFLPIAFLAMIPLFFAADHIFPWIEEPIPGKDKWLNVPFLSVRNLILYGGLVTVVVVLGLASSPRGMVTCVTRPS